MKQNDIFEQQMLPEQSTLQGGKYKVERRIASGGFGNTYEVTNTVFQERMALKEFFMKGISEREADSTTVSVSNTVNAGQFQSQKEKFWKEALRLRKLHNPHIVQVHDLFEENGTAYYAMDFVDGESLSNRLKRTKTPIPEAEVRSILSQVLDALEEVHSHGIWHLDLKPGNILVDSNGNARLIDFGASKQMSATEGYTTTTTAMCYTPGYAPTEQIDQKKELIGPWTDLYALGGTLYNLLTRNTPPSVSEMDDDDAFTYPVAVSGQMKQLIRWLMTPKRQRRPQSVAEVKKFLSQPFTENQPDDDDEEDTVFGQNPASHDTQETDEAPKSMPYKWIAVAVAAVVVVGGLIAWLSRSESDNQVSSDDAPVEIVAEAQTVTNSYFKSALGVCSYTGPVDAEGQPHGTGECSFTDGRLYRGPFEHGKMEGANAYFFYDNGDTFEGSFHDNRFSEGRYTLKDDGSYFVGTFKNGQPDDGIWYDKQGNKL